MEVNPGTVTRERLSGYRAGGGEPAQYGAAVRRMIGN